MTTDAFEHQLPYFSDSQDYTAVTYDHREHPSVLRPEHAAIIDRALWDKVHAILAEQARLVQLLVERVEIGEDELDIRLRADGLSGLPAG